MRLPTRRGEKLKKIPDEGPLYLTRDGVEKLRQKLVRIESQELPQAIEDVRITAEFGDFSENAEYQEAKARMRRLHNQVEVLKDKLQRVVVIEPDVSQAGRVQLGSTITLEENGHTRIFQLVGPQEVDPTRGRISHLSPLGAALMGHEVGETIQGYFIKDISV